MKNRPIEYIVEETHEQDRLVSPRQLLGDGDSHLEWSNGGDAVKVFIPTETYSEFQHPQFFLLFGRRGTGKTAIFKMLEHEINKGEIPEYGFVWCLAEESVYTEFTQLLYRAEIAELPENLLVKHLTLIWEWVVKVAAMTAVVHAGETDQDENILLTDEYDIVSAYLEETLGNGHRSSRVTFRRGPIEMFTDKLRETIEENQWSQTQAPIEALLGHLDNEAFSNASRALSALLRTSDRGDCLVLIDSIEEYDIHDPLLRSTIKALITTCRQFYASRSSKHIVCKAAFPSELRRHISLRDKMSFHIKYIRWQFRHLLSLLAKRFCLYLNPGATEVDLKMLDDHDAARAFLYARMPSTVSCQASELRFDTLAYLFRHTQKRPREIIQLFNVILTLAELEGVSPTELTTDIVVRGIHARLDTLVDNSYEVYRNIYDGLPSIVRSSLTGCYNHFPQREIRRILKKSSSAWAAANLDGDELEKLLFELGIFGIRDQVHSNVKDTGKDIWQVKYEYQFKDRLYPSEDSEIIVHPMFYTTLRCRVDRRILMYPTPQEEVEKESLRSVRG